MLSEVSTKFKLHMPNICAAENKYQTLFLNFFMHLTQKCAVSVVEAKLYTPSTLNIDFIQWHTQLNVCAVK